MNKKSKVILLPCSSYREEIVYENLEIGLELLGGIEKIVKKEESILLKPNLLKKAEVDKAVITHPSVVGMFARLMREKGYQDLSLADSCGNGTTTRVIHGTGIDRYLEKYGITAIDYSKGIRVEYPEGDSDKRIYPAERTSGKRLCDFSLQDEDACVGENYRRSKKQLWLYLWIP